MLLCVVQLLSTAVADPSFSQEVRHLLPSKLYSALLLLLIHIHQGCGSGLPGGHDDYTQCPCQIILLHYRSLTMFSSCTNAIMDGKHKQKLTMSCFAYGMHEAIKIRARGIIEELHTAICLHSTPVYTRIGALSGLGTIYPI